MIHYEPKPLPDNDQDGIIAITSAANKAKYGKFAFYLGQTDQGHAYTNDWRERLPEPPAPVVVPVTAPVSDAPATPAWLGCNIGAGAMGDGETYAYPTIAEIDLAKKFGMNILRWPFRAKRIIDSAGNVNPRVASQMIPALDYALSLGLKVIPEDHSYGLSIPAADGTSVMLSVEDVPTLLAAYNAGFGKYKGNPQVPLEFVNEPYKLAANWGPIADAIIDAFRADGWTNEIVINMPGYSPLRSLATQIDWAVARRDRDPMGKTIIGVHQYYDDNGSGTNGNQVMKLTSTSTLADAEAWIARALEPSVVAARYAGLHLMLGETGIRTTTTIGKLGYQALRAWLDKNADVFKYVTPFILSTWMPYSTKDGAAFYGLTQPDPVAPSANLKAWAAP